ncbi:hypothetical protein [Paenibacillus harenae]|uniref:hypothetical protein n=1 Tax=Paenibacillus harenae TaxID=306543 RepID=UPI000412A6A5|nr:hypothetical protein [Paenibacillus harenae]
MRRKALLSFAILIIVGGVAFYYVPRDIDFDAQGVKYRLGKENRGTEELVRIRIQGKLYRSWLGDQTFNGIVDIEGEELPVPENQRQLTIPLDNNRSGWVVYHYVEDAHPKHYSYGMIYTTDDFRKVTISIHEQSGQDESKGWNGEDGYMLSTPASSREEALRISNELMSEFWQGYVFR